MLYVSSEKFINQFQDHSRNNAINDFIHFYQLIDVLIIDDVSSLTVQKEARMLSLPSSITCISQVSNWYYHQINRQKILDGLQESLLSRFRWGLSADLQMPDYDTRIEILDKKDEERWP